MLTLYYVSATFLQSWRINKICQKITEQLALQSSVSFYALPESSDDGFDAATATSEICVNREVAKVSEILWLHGNHRGACIMPLQNLQTTSWISFPDGPGLQPFAYNEPSESLLRSLSLNKDGLIRLLIETGITPNYDYIEQEDKVMIENYGKLLAWKIDSHLAVLIETDIEHFTKLLIETFLQNHFFINDQLPLLRIESVKNDGVPQPYSKLSSHLRKPIRNNTNLTFDEWTKHLEDLRALSILANQATEYVYNKNKTEGKTGIIKPELVPLQKRASSAVDSKTLEELPKKPELPIKFTQDPKKLDNLERPTKVLPKESLSKDTDKIIKTEQLDTAAKSTEPGATTSAADNASSFSPKSQQSPSKNRTKPTEIRKPPAVGQGCLKTNMPVGTTELVDKKTSELEKIAAVKVAERSKSKSPTPIKRDEEVTETKSNASKINEMPTTSSSWTKTEKTTMETKENANVESITIAPEISAISDITPNKSILNATVVAGAPSSVPSAVKDNAKRPSLKRHKDSLTECKPLNVLVYAETATARESAVNTLKEILSHNTYTIYPLTAQQVEQKHWLNTTALLVVCGTVPNEIGELFVDYFLRGGKVLSLCSDILHFILPTYRTAEVREHELVQFSYNKWHKVKMMHHIFCYQPSPVKKNFSTDSDDSALTISRKPSVELKDLKGDIHQLDVKVLGMEETWNTPSLLLASNEKSGGVAVFSQVHLEINPTEFEADENKFSILKQNDNIRYEIFADLLKTQLSLSVQSTQTVGSNVSGPKMVFKNAFFLGRYEDKFALLMKLKTSIDDDNILATPNLTMKFFGAGDKVPKDYLNILPILIHSCPEDFYTVDYFENLKTKYIGRLVIYTPIINSSQNVIADLELANGIAVIPREQTIGIGRSNNQWLSPPGCAMFSIQLHIETGSPLGQRLPLIQHIVGAAMVNALKSHPLYKVLNLGLKWPNDAYANGITKIGGLVVKTMLMSTKAIVNIGSGINLDNQKPTICINDMIHDYNSKNQGKLSVIKYEILLALIFNEIERLIESVQGGDFESFYKVYYDLWLHSNQPILICDASGSKKEAKVIGIDEYGYLKVQLTNGVVEIVQPDGNSFDMLRGLIIPKFY